MPEAVLTIDSVAAGGDGVARDGNLVVFVPRTAPADRGLVTYTQRGTFARGNLRRLESPSPHRVDPVCVHYDGDMCGGCQLQHISYAEQLRAKQQIVTDALQRIARRTDVAVTMHESPKQWGYRRRLTLALRREGQEWQAGLHPYDDPGAIFNMRECSITEDSVLSIWRDILRNPEFLPRGRELRGSVLVIDGSAHFSVEGGTSWPTAGDLARACPAIATVWWTGKDGVRRRMYSRAGASNAGASFAQINALVAEQLREHVVSVARAHAPRSAIDAYSGTGDIARALASDGVRVTAIESDADAVESFSHQLPAGSRAIRGRVEEHIAACLPTDVVVLNPPRAGVREEVTTALCGTGAVTHAIIYVSCNPATLARDLARLPEFSIKSLHCFDMFPQTAHVETVCELVREGAP